MWRRRRATVAGLTSPGDEDPTLGDLSLPDGRGRDRCARVDDAQGKQPPARHRSRLPHTRGLPSPGSQCPRTCVGPGGRRWLCPAGLPPGCLYLPVLQFGDSSAAFRALHDNDHSGKKPAACGCIPDFLSHRGDADARGSPAEVARLPVAVPRERASHVLSRYAGA